MMNILKESLFSSSDSETKPKKTRHHRSKANDILQENNTLSQPLLSSTENAGDSIELGTMDSDDDNNETTFNVRHTTRSRHIKKESTPSVQGSNSIIIVEKPILPQETLQAFAIRYRVPVSQLKRLNNLQNDQDFYALKYCRVPVRRFGILHESPSSSTIVDLNEQSSINPSIPSTQTIQQDHRAFLNAMDHDLASMRTKVEQLIETPTTTLIPDQPSVTMMSRSTKKTTNDLNCDGADCGCKFWHILLIILLIALLVPLVYIYIYLESPIILSEHIPI